MILVWGTLVALEGLSPGETPPEDQMVAIAVEAYGDKLYPLAESQIVAFLQRFPQSSRRLNMIYLLGRTYFLQGKFSKARETFLGLINDDDVDLVDQANGLFWLAESCAQLDRWEEAKAYYIEFVGKTSDSPFLEKSLFALGLICLKDNALAEAEGYFSKAVTAYPYGQYVSQERHYLGLIYSRSRNYHRAVQFLRKAISVPSALPTDLRKDALFQLAENRLRLGQFQLALPYYMAFYSTYPEDSRAPLSLYGAGGCQLETGQREAALGSFQKLIKQYPKSDPYHRALCRIGKIHLEKSDYQKAREAFSQVAKESADSELLVQALVNLGWCYLNIGDFDEMTRVAHRLLKLQSGQIRRTLPQLLLGEAHFQRGQYKDALPYFFNLLNTPSQRENALYRISRCYFYEGEYKDAITNVEILSLEYPDSDHLEDCLYLKGQAAYHLGDTEKAIASFVEILDKERRDRWTVAALYELGKIYYERKDLERAKDLFARIVDTAPEEETSILASYYLGIICFKEKNSSEALRHLNDALESNNRAIRAECHYRIGEIYVQEEVYYLSLHHFQTIVDKLNDQKGWVELALFEIGNIRLAQGESAEAEKAFQRVLDESKDPDLREASKKILAPIEQLKPSP